MIYEPDFGDQGKRGIESKNKPNIQNQKLYEKIANGTQRTQGYKSA